MTSGDRLRKVKGAGLSRTILELAPAALLAAALTAVGLVHAASRVMVVRLGYELSAQENENRALMRDRDRLKVELATLKSPLRLERVAREQLSMGPPAPGTVYGIDSGRAARDDGKPRMERALAVKEPLSR